MIFLYNLENINEQIITFPDFYFTPEYGKLCELSDNCKWECAIYKDLIYVYMKRPIQYNDKIYYDLITPYGYAGFFFLYQNTFDEFIVLFHQLAINNNYITEVLRQNPYMNINLKYYKTITNKAIYGINVNDFNYYFNNILNTKKRNMFTKAIKLNYIFNIDKLNNINMNDFKQLYYKNMDNIKASKYYYFNDEYFNEIVLLNNSFLITITFNNNIIGACIIFKYNDFIHYHLSCNDKSSNCITDFMIISIVKNIGINKIIILGGGLNENDSLSVFKKNLSNINFNYVIYKNILNNNIFNQLALYHNNDKFPPYL